MNFGTGHESSIATIAQVTQVQNWSDQDSDIKSSVRRLLQELQGRYPDLHGCVFKPELSAPGYGH